MSAGFKKSLFGFNCNDVIEYIKSSQNSAKKRENELSEKIDKQNSEIETLKAVNSEVCRKLAKYESDYMQISTLCNNLSELYISAKSASQTLINTTEENCKITQEQLENNFDTIEEVQSALSKLKEQVNSAADIYISKVESVSDCLKTAKEIIESNKAEADITFKKFNESFSK